jgi:creatinine amidohydrolase
MERLLTRIDSIDIGHIVQDEIRTVILPIGSIEPHGVVSLGTDTFIVEGFTKKLAEQLNAIIAPTINYSILDNLSTYPGTVNVSEISFKNFVKDISVSLINLGFKRIIYFNGHKGNINALNHIQGDIWKEKAVKTIVVNWWVLAEGIAKEIYNGEGYHAAVEETALMIVLDPSLVRKEYFEKNLSYIKHDGIIPVPLPAPITISSVLKGYPCFDDDKAEIYFNNLFNKICDEVLSVFEGWDKNYNI